MQIAFVLDIIIAVLLVLTITYAVRLNQRLGQLRNDKNELQDLAKTFAEATAKAEASIQQLKISSESLQGDLKNAEALRDDLAYLVDRGGRTADQMVATVRSPGHAVEDDDDLGDDDNRLIEEAVRAANTSGAGRQAGKRAEGKRSGTGLLGRLRGAAAVDDGAPPVPRRATGHPEPQKAPDFEQPRPLGGGLGGLSPQDRLVDERPRGGESETVGDTDAARELLKALSSVK